jgi:hypothetical protein
MPWLKRLRTVAPALFAGAAGVKWMVDGQFPWEFVNPVSAGVAAAPTLDDMDLQRAYFLALMVAASELRDPDELEAFRRSIESAVDFGTGTTAERRARLERRVGASVSARSVAEWERLQRLFHRLPVGLFQDVTTLLTLRAHLASVQGEDRPARPEELERLERQTLNVYESLLRFETDQGQLLMAELSQAAGANGGGAGRRGGGGSCAPFPDPDHSAADARAAWDKLSSDLFESLKRTFKLGRMGASFERTGMLARLEVVVKRLDNGVAIPVGKPPFGMPLPSFDAPGRSVNGKFIVEGQFIHDSSTGRPKLNKIRIRYEGDTLRFYLTDERCFELDDGDTSGEIDNGALEDGDLSRTQAGSGIKAIKDLLERWFRRLATQQ